MLGLKREIDQVAAEHRVVGPAIGIGQQLARREVERRQVEVATVVGRLRRAAVGGLVLEQEELDLGVGVEGEPHVGGLRQRPAQDVPGVGPGRRPVRGTPGRRLGRHLHGRQ